MVEQMIKVFSIGAMIFWAFYFLGIWVIPILAVCFLVAYFTKK